MDNKAVIGTAIGVVLGVAVVVGTLMYVVPKYGVWQKELSGKAKLREAEWSRQIKVEEAKAALEAAAKPPSEEDS